MGTPAMLATLTQMGCDTNFQFLRSIVMRLDETTIVSSARYCITVQLPRQMRRLWLKLVHTHAISRQVGCANRHLSVHLMRFDVVSRKSKRPEHKKLLCLCRTRKTWIRYGYLPMNVC